MKRQIVISLGYRTEKGMCLLSWWEDYADLKRTRFMRNGHFNVDKWEAAQTHLFMRPGADPRTAWKEAWHMVRKHIRDSRSGRTRLGRPLAGYSFLESRMPCDPALLP